MKRLIFNIYKLFLFPHILIYLNSRNRHLIDKDLKRWSKEKGIYMGKFSLLLHFLVHSKDFRNIFYFRTRSILTKILNIYCRKDTSFIIDINTCLGAGILTGHPYCTILNANSIGENFFVNHLVTIGESDGKKPTIGDNVKVYTNATIIGDINIGNNCVIGAGAVVVKDVPDNSTVVGNPAKIIRQKL